MRDTPNSHGDTEPGGHPLADLLASAVGVWRWDVAGSRLLGDSRFAELYGLDRIETARGLTTDAFFGPIHADDRMRIRIAVAGVMHGADLFNKQFRLSRPDGGFRWVAAQGRTERDAFGRLLRFEGVLTDITDQKRVEERLRVAQSAGGVGSFEYVGGFGTVEVSDQFCRLLGLTPTDAVALRSINALLPPDCPPLIEIGQDMADGPQPTQEFHITRPDTGETRWIARRGEVRRDGPDGGVRFIGVIHDITDFKAIEGRLRELTVNLEERVAERTRERDRVWNNSRDLLLVADLNGAILSASPSWERVLGYRPEELVGSSRRNLVVEEDIAASAETFRRTLAGDPVDNFESRLKHKDGALRWISWQTARDDDYFYAYGRDVTDDKARTDALLRTEAQLRQSQKMEAVGQLTGGLAHDFNNMLTGVIGGLDIVRRRVREGRLTDVDRFIDSASVSAQRAAGLTHRLLAFSRQQSLDPQSVDARDLLVSMQDLLARTLGEQVRLEVDAPDGLWPALADSNQLESAVLNLAINARDAMPDGGRLVIGAANVTLDRAYADRHPDAHPGDHIVISVRDTGTGMPADIVAKAFEPFFTTKPIGQGTGLGLSMIYGFVQQSGGHATLKSEVGVGTVVKMYLPRHRGEASAPSASDAAQVRPSGDGETILVVEDEASVRILIVEALRELGYRTLEADRGEAALAHIRSAEPIDLLVSDVGLPGLNGRQVAEMARQHRPDLRVLFVTAYAAGATVRADFLGPGMDMISKPFAIDDLAAKVGSILSN